jgi:hypothetical protein
LITLKGNYAKVLVASARRCCICFGLKRDSRIKQGQIAHLDRNHSNKDFKNLAFMCFCHHDQYDTKTSQSKGFTQSEVKYYRDLLYRWVSDFQSGTRPIAFTDYGSKVLVQNNLKPLRHKRTISLLSDSLIGLFPHFKEPCVITTAKLRGSPNLDPEDIYATNAILKLLIDIRGHRNEEVKVRYFNSLGEVGIDKHIISLGGGWTNPLNRHISYMPPFIQKPRFDLYFYTNPRVKKKAIRKFYGKRHILPLRAVVDKRLGKHTNLYAETDHKGWLTKDYLLITTIHLKCLMPLFDESLFITSFAGLYGPGTMGVELFFKNFDELIKSITKLKNNNLCFQTLCSVEEIDHSGDFSYAKSITHVRTYAITD